MSYSTASAFNNGIAASVVVGQTSFTASSAGNAANKFTTPSDLDTDSFGNLWISDNDNNRVVRYNAPITSLADQADIVLGQSGFGLGAANRGGAVGAGTLSSPHSVITDSSGNLWVADRDNNRVLRYDGPTFTNGEDATLVLGQALPSAGNTANRGGAVAANTLNTPVALEFDSLGNLWVSDRGNNRVLRYDAPFTNGEDAAVILGQTTVSASASGTTQSKFNTPHGIIVDDDGNLWIADRVNHRVLRYNTPFTSLNDQADMVLGQATFTAVTANRGGAVAADTLNTPTALAIDRFNTLWIADTDNNRVLRYHTPISQPDSADTVFGRPDFTTSTAGATANRLDSPFGVEEDSLDNLWVGDTLNNRVLRFDLPSAPLNVRPGPITTTSIQLFWDAPANSQFSTSGFKIFRAPTPTGSYALIQTLAGGAGPFGFIDNNGGAGLAEGTAFRYKIQARNGTDFAGNYGANSTERFFGTGGGNFNTQQTFQEGQAVGAGGTYTVVQSFQANMNFSAGAQTFATGQNFGTGTAFAKNQPFEAGKTFDFSGSTLKFGFGTNFGAPRNFGTGVNFTGKVDLVGYNTFGTGAKFGAGQTFPTVQNFGERVNFTAPVDFVTGQQFSAGTIFPPLQTFPANEVAVFQNASMKFGFGTDFGTPRIFATSMNFTGKQTFVGYNTFGTGAKFGAGQTFPTVQNFASLANFTAPVDFVTGQRFPAGAIFPPLQTFPANEDAVFLNASMKFGFGSDFGAPRTFADSINFTGKQTFVGYNTFGTGAKFGAGQTFPTVQNFASLANFTAPVDFVTGQRFPAGAIFPPLQTFPANEAAVFLNASMKFGFGTDFGTPRNFTATSMNFTGKQTFVGYNAFGTGAKFGAAQTFPTVQMFRTQPNFTAPVDFATGQIFPVGAIFPPLQTFPNGETPVFLNASMKFGSGTTFGDARTFGTGANFTGKQTFAGANTFSSLATFGAAQNFGATAQTFSGNTTFGKNTDFSGNQAHVFQAGAVFDTGTTFAVGQDLPTGAVLSSGLLLAAAVDCNAACSNVAAANILTPGEFVAPGTNPAPVSTVVSPSDTRVSIPGLGLSLTPNSVSTEGTVTADILNPATLTGAAFDLNGQGTITISTGTFNTISNVIDISFGNATASPPFTLTFQYQDANIPAGLTESQITLMHFTNGAWERITPTSIDSVNNIVTATVTSLSPFSVGAGSDSSTGGGGGSSAAPSFSGNTYSKDEHPLTIAGINFDISQYSNTVDTATVKTGNPFDLTLLLNDDSGALEIEHVAIYMNLRGFTRELSNSDTYIIYEKNKPIQIVDPNGFFSSVSLKPTVKNGKLELDFDIAFSKPMKKSDIILRTWDTNRNSADTKMFGAIEVVQGPPPESTPTTDVSETPATGVSETQETSAELMDTITNWGGYSSVVASDTEILKSVGIEGTYIPGWFKNVARWTVFEEITPNEFVNAIKYMHEKQIII